MSDTKRTWDWAWKVLCSPQYPWCKSIISKLLGEQYVDFEIVGDMSTESATIEGETQLADKYIQVVVDHEKRILHLEFQSSVDREMAKRILEYGLHRAVKCGDSSPFNEHYRLPDSFLVNVRKTASRGFSECKLLLDIGHQQIEITYPSIDAFTQVPEIEKIMNSKSYDELSWAIRDFSAIFSDRLTENTRELFARAHY